MRGIEEVPYALGLAGRLPGHLRRPLRPEQARAEVERRLAERERRVLALLAEALSRPCAPYGRLLRRAGCELGDLERLVGERGAEGALGELARAGVYLTVDELKGRRPVRRGSDAFDVGPARLRNALVGRDVPARTSGSRGAGTHLHLGLAFVRDCAVDTLVHLVCRGGLGWRKATWEAPGAGAMFRLLKYSSFGGPAAAWLTPVDPAAPGLHPRYRRGERLIRALSAAVRRPIPSPSIATLDDPLPAASWLAGTLSSGETPHLFCFSSAAVRLCAVAEEAGLDIAGAQLTLAGEPVTDARLAAIRRAGVEGVPRYGSIETGPIGYGCLAPAAADDVHVLQDLHAVIQAGPGVPELPSEALLVTSLARSSPLTLVNVSMGDRAVLSDRPCGCPLERIGWAPHLHGIRSFEKLTAGGVTFAGTDVVGVLEETLPGRFGGGPSDYQVVEREGADGLPEVTLRVDPRLGPLPEEEVASAFLAALAPGDGGERLMGMVWEQGRVLRVERRRPAATRSGKVHHVVIDGER